MSKKLSFCSLCVLPVLTVLVFFSVGSLQVSASDDLEDLDVFWFSEDFYKVSGFVDGYASFTYDGEKYGIIDLQGNVLLKPTYDYIAPFSGDYTIVINRRSIGVIDKKFQLVSHMKSMDGTDERLSRAVFEGYSIFVINNKVGLLNQSKKVVIPPKFNELQLSDFSDDLVMANDDKGYYFFDRKGKVVFQIACDDLHSFENGMAVFRVGKNYGLIDQKCNIVLEAKYANLGDFSEGLVAFAKKEKFDSKWGFIELNGKVVIPAKYDRVWPFKNGVAFAKLNDKIFAFDKKGNVLKTFVDYEEVESFTDDFYQFVQLKEHYFKKGLLDRDFTEILPAKYLNISPFSEGLSRIVEITHYEDGKEKHGFIDKNGKFVIPLIFDSAEDFYEGIAVVKLNGRCGRIRNPLKYSASKNNSALKNHSDSKDHSEPVKDSKPMNSEQKAIYSKVNLQVNSHEIKDLEIYNIGGENYFKLRDIAKLAFDKGQGFSVNWDAKENLILLKKGEKYVEVGGELAQGDGKDKRANESKGKVKVDERDVFLKAYLINGNNYYRLRDLAKELNFKVNWNEDKKRIEVEF